MNSERLKEIDERAAKSRPGEWLFTHKDVAIADTGDHDHRDSITAEEGCFVVADIWHDDNYSCQNAEFIAHARTDIPDLLAHIQALEEALRTAKAESLVEAASHSIELRRDGIGGLARISVANWLRKRAAALSPAPAKADQR